MIVPPLQLGEYTLVRRVAVGATSEVHEGRHVASGTPVAVKILHDAWCLHPEVVARFRNEAYALQQIQHPHVIEVLAAGTLPDGPPFMILEWLPADLEQVLAWTHGPIAEPAALRIAAQLTEALHALHARGIVHRDLKPANVLLTHAALDRAAVKLADLGLAKVRPEEAAAPVQAAVPVSTGSSALLGTSETMAPEQWIRSKDAGPKVDVYALGVLLFRLLAGRLPFVAEEQKDLMYLHLFEAPPLGMLDGITRPEVRALVARMLDKKPALRPTMREVKEVVDG